MSNTLTVFFPACGGEPTVAAIQALRAGWPGPDELWIVGSDCDADKQAIVNADRFLVSPRRDDPRYLDFLLQVCDQYDVDVIWPNPTEEQMTVSAHREAFERRGVRVLAPPLHAVECFADKARTYREAAKRGLAVPQWRPVRNVREVAEAARELGYPAKPVVFRRRSGRGAIGLRILRADRGLAEHLFHEAPDGKLLSLEALEKILEQADSWPACMVCEFLPGREYDVDCFCAGGRLQVAATRLNEAMMQGSSWRAVTVDRPDLREACAHLVEPMQWQYICSVTFRENEAGIPALVEVNGRMPSSINLTWKAGPNLPVAALRLCLGREWGPLPPTQPGVRLVRYFAEAYAKP